MKRGDVVLVREPRSPASKPRPCVVVQRTSTLAASPKILACPLTSILNGPAGQRPFVAPGPPGGLRKPSEVQVDWVHAFVRTSIGPGIGHLDEATLRSVDEALRRWLDL